MKTFLQKISFAAQCLGFVSMQLVAPPPPKYVRRMAETRSKIRQAEKTQKRKVNRRGFRGK